MATILEEIVAAKKGEVEAQKRLVSQAELEERVKAMSLPLNLSGALLGDRVRLIAEVKKASPSRGLLAENFDPRALAQAYVDNGAAAVSVLTDPRFQGTLDDLEAVVQVAAQRGRPSFARTSSSIRTRCTRRGAAAQTACCSLRQFSRHPISRRCWRCVRISGFRLWWRCTTRLN